DFLAGDDVVQPGAGADRQAAGLAVAGYTRERLDFLEVDHAVRARRVVFHPADQIRTTGEGRRIGRAQQLDRVVDRGGGSVLEVFHGFTPSLLWMPSPGRSTRFGDSWATRPLARRWRWQP